MIRPGESTATQRGAVELTRTMSDPPTSSDRDRAAAAAIRANIEAALSAKVGGGAPRKLMTRDAHPEAHGLVHAEWVSADHLPEEFAHGIFSVSGVFPAWMRLSNAAQRDDAARDAHGLALKLMGLPQTLVGASCTADLLFVDSPEFFIKDAAEYADFFAHRRLRHFLTHPLSFWRFVRMGQRHAHLFEPTYHSAVPYRCGDRIVKYRLRPLLSVPDATTRVGEGERFHGRRLMEILRTPHPDDGVYSMRFAFEVHVLGRDEEKRTQWIDDARSAWPAGRLEGGAPRFVQLAELRVPPQHIGDPRRRDLAENLSFRPDRVPRENAPVGSIGRTRAAIYGAIAEMRRKYNNVPLMEPSDESIASSRPNAIFHPSVHRHAQQGAFAAVIPVRDPERLAAHIRSSPLPLERVAGLHFGRVLVVPAGAPFRVHPEERLASFRDWLVVSTNFDGEVEAHVRQLAEVCEPELRALLSLGADGTASLGVSGDPDALAQQLLAHQVPASAFYVGAVGRSVERIRHEHALREAIEDFVDHHGAELPDDAVAVRERIRAFVRKSLSSEWAIEPPPLPKNQSRRYLAWASAVAGAALLLAILSAPTGLWVLGAFLTLLGLAAALFYRRLAHADSGDAAALRDEVPYPYVAEGPAPDQNWITHVVGVRPTRFRKYTLKAVLWAINFLARVRFNEGKLGGIETIHFARWILTDDDTRLVFFSNYSGTWEAYLDAFIDLANIGLTGVWSHTHGFPAARPLFSQGAEDGPRFKRWTRNRHIETQQWYSAYPNLSVRNINQNSRIRAGLFGDMNEAQAQEWLRLLGRAPL